MSFGVNDMEPHSLHSGASINRGNTMIKKYGTAAFLFLTCAVTAFAQDSKNNIETAEAFLTALEQGRPESVADLMHDEIWFEDPTWGAERRGKEAVLKAYKGYTGGVHDLMRQRVKGYESNNTVVLEYVFSVRLDVHGDGNPEGFVPMMGNGIRIIGFRDGKVVRHTDLSDYTQLKAKIAEAKAQQP